MATEATARTAAYEAGSAVTAEEYERIVLDDPGVTWELHRGRLREKPGMSVEHNWLMFYVAHLLQSQLSLDEFRLRTNGTPLGHSPTGFYVPDVAVIPADLERELRRRPGTLDAYAVPLPLVVEIWSPSTGKYDVNEKLVEYRRRCDLEIWRIHPYERTLTTWRRQDDGSYSETVYSGGLVEPVALPGTTIDLDLLFDA